MQGLGESAEVAKPRRKSGGIGEIGGFTVQGDDVVDAETAVFGEPLKIWCDAGMIEHRQHNIGG